MQVWRGKAGGTSNRVLRAGEQPRGIAPAVSVVIGTLDRRWYLQRTIESVRAELGSRDGEIIVVDGGSSDGTVDWLAKQKDVLTIVQHNRGTWRDRAVRRRSWGYFMNLGFKTASAPYVCMLSDDCLAVPGAIGEGLNVFERHEQRLGAVAFYWRNWPEEDAYHVGRTFGDRVFVNHGLFAREALEAVGFADEDAFGFYHADGDLALRLDAAGWPCVDSPSSFVEHFSHANVDLRGANAQRQSDDWTAYAARWEHLGGPSQAWVTREFVDPHRTAERYWGRRARWTPRLNEVRRRARTLPRRLARLGHG